VSVLKYHFTKGNDGNYAGFVPQRGGAKAENAPGLRILQYHPRAASPNEQ